MISNRLKEIALLIPDKSNVIDVGCDHALLDIYLAKEKECTCLACDINKNALNQAIKNIDNSKLNEKIKTKLTDGLIDIEINKDDYIVIAGMGTNTIKHILGQGNLSDNLVIASNNEIAELRKYVVSIGYIIKKEKFVEDKGKYYVIICFSKGSFNYNSDDLEYGPYLKNNIDYIKYQINCLKQIKGKIPLYKFILHLNINKKIKKLKKFIS